jgi:nicotinate-nucleotide adenylyltransferase
MDISDNNKNDVVSILKQQPIGLYGGTFDPIHYGHLRPNLELSERLSLAQVRFIPAAQPAHRKQPQCSAQQRLEMVQLAIKNEPRFVLDDREMQREGASYMVDTLMSLRHDYPKQSLCLLMGMDAFENIDKWSRWQELLNYAHIVVSQRPNSCFSDQSHWPKSIQAYYQYHKATHRQQLQDLLHGKIQLEVVTQLSISATDIRQRLKKHQSVRYLMPDAVINLIKYNDFYR